METVEEYKALVEAMPYRYPEEARMPHFMCGALEPEVRDLSQEQHQQDNAPATDKANSSPLAENA